DLLFRGRQYNDAANEYQNLLASADASNRSVILLGLGISLNRAERAREAKKVLDSIPNLASDQEAERLYNLATISRSDNDEAGFGKLVDQIRNIAPSSSALEQALLLGGNMYLVKPDYDRAIDYYRELHTRFPNGALGPYAHWKVAWLSLRMGRNTEAE